MSSCGVGVIVISDIIFANFFFSVHLAYLFAYQNKKNKHKVTFTKSYQKSLRGVKCFSCEGVPLKLEKISTLEFIMKDRMSLLLRSHL
jgi:hypothetical protein